jgi:glycosyltransferase involved in cell wall biosynthesis
LPFGYHSAGVNRWNHFWYRVALGGRFHRREGPVVLIVCNVLGLGWLGKLGEDIVIYDCADEISEFRQARLKREAVRAQERELMRRVDAVVTTSQRLYDAKAGYAGKIKLIRNAADVHHFNRALSPGPRPPDIAHLKKPIVGFYGFLADWLDWPLIERIVTQGRDFDWVFIGPSTRDLSGLTKLENFHSLGRKPYAELPAYLAHFACAHIPFDRTPLTVNVNPVKLYEYLAGGVPVVATPLPELEAFRDVCRLAENPDEYLRLIREEIVSDSFPKRQARAARVASETWENRLGQYLDLIAEIAGR